MNIKIFLFSSKYLALTPFRWFFTGKTALEPITSHHVWKHFSWMKKWRNLIAIVYCLGKSESDVKKPNLHADKYQSIIMKQYKRSLISLQHWWTKRFCKEDIWIKYRKRKWLFDSIKSYVFFLHKHICIKWTIYFICLLFPFIVVINGDKT